MRGRVGASTAQFFFFFFFLDKLRKLSKIVSVLQSASVERFNVSCMRDFFKNTCLGAHTSAHMSFGAHMSAHTSLGAHTSALMCVFLPWKPICKILQTVKWQNLCSCIDFRICYCPTSVPTCRLLVGGAGPIRESVLEGADLAVRGAGVAVGARGDDGVAAAVQDTEMPEDRGQTVRHPVN